MTELPFDTAGRNEASRLAALAYANILDTPPEPRFEHIVALVSAICETPIALVSLVDSDRQWFKAKVGVEVPQTPIDTSVCALAIKQQGLFQIGDLAADPRTQNFSLVTEPPHLRFYAGFPIFSPTGLALGSLCAIDQTPRPAGLSARQAIALEALARLAAVEIERGSGNPDPRGRPGDHSVGIWDWDVQLDRVTADPAFSDLHGIDPSRGLEGAPAAEFFAHIHPDDLPETLAAIDEAVRTGKPFSAEYRLVRPQGRARWVLAQGRCQLAADGTPLRFPGISFDIDARKSAELRLAALVELTDRLRAPGPPADLAFAAAEILARTLDVSRAGYGTIDPVAETVTIERDWNAPGIKSLAGTLHFRDYGSYIDNLKRGETVAVPDAYGDPRTRGKADELTSISAQAFINMPVTEQGGFVALLYLNHATARPWTAEELAFVRDVAERTRDGVERRRAELDLAQLAASLEEQVEARTRELLIAEASLRQAQKMEAVGQLTGGLAHDFNNLLTGISGAIEMMQVRIAQGRLDELERYTNAAQGAARRAAALTHRLLAFSRRQTLDPKAVDVDRLVADLEDLLARSVGGGVTVTTKGMDGLWPALVDPNQLENAILNLCINARDAMPLGGMIMIETSNTTIEPRAAREHDVEPGDYLVVCVADTGTGMTPDVCARAFDPFYTTKPLGEGTGLGLSMIYGFARQSGGYVHIATELGQGTKVCVFLPRYHGAAETADSVVTGPRLENLALQADGRTVLVVDDEPTIRSLVVEVIEEIGMVPLEAADGAAALRILQSGARIDLLVTDVGLPGQINGRQVADAALALLPKLRVLFITGYAETAVIGDRQLDRNMALLTKPFAMDALVRKVRGLLP